MSGPRPDNAQDTPSPGTLPGGGGSVRDQLVALLGEERVGLVVQAVEAALANRSSWPAPAWHRQLPQLLADLGAPLPREHMIGCARPSDHEGRCALVPDAPENGPRSPQEPRSPRRTR